jgi:Tol biopolymer transport system component
VAAQIHGSEIYIFDVSRGDETRFTFYSDYDDQPAWYPLTDRIAFASTRSGPISIYVQNAGGSGEAEHLVAEETFSGAAPAISPDEKYIIYQTRNTESQFDIWYMPLTDAAKPKAFLTSPFDEAVPAFSPDGRYVAYQSDETGEWEIYIRSFPDGEEKRTVSIDGGRNPVWKGDELFFVARGHAMMAAKVDLRSGIKVDTPKKLFTWQSLFQRHPLYVKYDVSSDGQRFVVVKSLEEDKTEIVIVENWFKEFEGKISEGK